MWKKLATYKMQPEFFCVQFVLVFLCFLSHLSLGAGSVADFTLSPPELQHLVSIVNKKLYQDSLVMIPPQDNSVCVF